MLNLSNHYFEFGPFRLDLRERLLLKDSEPISLTPKAFNVLTVLVQHSGSLVEKDELLNQVWPDTIVEESSLSQKIYQLRKILDDGSGEEKYIQTVPRHGYRFVAEVTEIKPTGVDVPEPPAITPAAGDSRKIEYTRAHIVVEDEILEDSAPPAVKSLNQSAAAASFARVTAERNRWQLIAAASLMILLTVAGYFIWRTKHLAGSSSVHRIG